MPKYLIGYTREETYEIEIEADDEEQAIGLVLNMSLRELQDHDEGDSSGYVHSVEEVKEQSHDVQTSSN